MKYHPYLLIFCTILTIGGVVSGIGAWLVLPDLLGEELRSFALDNLQLMSDDTLHTIILQILKVNTMDLLRVYLCGICLAGIPILIVFLFLKCFSIGFCTCLLIQTAVPLFLSRMLFVPVLMLAVMEGYLFSLSLFDNHMQGIVRQWVRYTGFFLLLALCMALCSIVDGAANFYYLQ